LRQRRDDRAFYGGTVICNQVDSLLRETNDFDAAYLVADIPGMSSPKVCLLLNRLVSRMDPGEHYLEIGTWQGRTLLSAAMHNRGRLCVACDKFRAYGRYTGLGFRARRALRRNLDRYAEDRATVHFYDMSSSKFFSSPRFEGTVGVFFYDGDHSYRGTRDSIAAGARWLSERAALLVDDWNVPRIRQATLDGLEDASVRILWHRALDGDHTERTWWNGLGAFYVEANANYGS
jgi:hypothetical protein